MKDHKHLRRFRRGSGEERKSIEPTGADAQSSGCAKFSILVCVLSSLFCICNGGIACMSNPCLYGVCVDDANSSYSCFCADGYTGAHCQTEWNECWSQPCLNGGDCFDLVAAYNCSCAEGFSGVSCEVDRDECMSDPCQNNGTCVDGSNGFKCHCLPGYTGSVCEWDISVCNETGVERCLNGGVCVEGPGERFWCICAPGWGGAICEEPLDPCLIHTPCLHGGLCLPRDSDFICACPFGFTGERCEFELSLCKENPCLNGAICIEEGNSSVCYCVPDFHGDFCQFQYDECLLPPKPSCKNGGTCIDGVDGFTCSCPPDVTGRYCECPIGQDCTNHTYHPILPTTESQDFENSTLVSRHGSRRTLLPHDFSKVTAPILTTTERISTILTGDSKGSGSEDERENDSTFSTGLSTIERITSSTQTNLIDSGNEIPVTVPVTLMPKFSTLSSSDDKYFSTVTSPSTKTQIGVFSSTTFISESVSDEIQDSRSPTTDVSTTNHAINGTSILNWTKDAFAVSTTDGDQEDDTEMKQQTPTDQLIDDTTTTQAGFQTEGATSYIETSRLTSARPKLSSEASTEIESSLSTSPSTDEPEVPNNTPKSKPSTDYSDYSNVSSAPEYSTSTAVDTIDISESENEEEVTVSSIIFTKITSAITSLFTSVTEPTKSSESSSEIETRSSVDSFDLSSVPLTTTKLSTKSADVDYSHRNLTSTTFAVSTVSLVTLASGDKSTATADSRTEKSRTWSTDGEEITTAESHFEEHETKDVPWTSTAEETSDLPDYGTATPDYVDTTLAEPKRCSKTESPCLNGGVCFNVESQITCRCPFQFMGTFCETPTNYTEVSLLPTSWLLFRVVTPVNESEHSGFTHTLEATFRIVSEEGVVFTLAEADEGPVSNYYMQMSIYRGRLQLLFSCGLQSVRFSESKQRVDTGQPTRISASLSMWISNTTSNLGKCRAELKLNNTLAVSGEQLRPLLSTKKDVALAHLVFGSWPRSEFHKSSSEEDEIFSEKISTSPGVVACLSDVKVNGRSKVLLADVTAGSDDVSECVQLACLSNPCLFGGTCDETLSNNWSCRCPSGRLGSRCEISVCENNPCHAGGTCLVHPGTNFVCLCPLGREGIFCEKEHFLTRPCFFPTFVDINPFLALPLLPRHESFRHSIEVHLKFVPSRTHQVALLAYIGHGPKDHMALGYVHGRIILTWDLGSGPRRIFTTKDFLSGSEHEVRFGRIGKEGWLKVKGDNMTHIGQSIGRMIQLNTRPIVFFGGFDDGNMSILPHDLPKHSGFEGCLSHLEIKTASSQATKFFPPGPANGPAKGRSVVQQDYDICASNPCKQRGICLPHGPSFTCLCAQGWFGPLCAEPRNPCDMQRNMCAEGSTCVPLQVGYECDCPLGKTGRFCNSVESRGSVVWPELYFSGKRSFLEVPRSLPLYSDPGLLEHSCVEFEVKPQAWKGPPAAQVLFFSQDPDTGDFMTLLITADRALELILGSRDEAPLILSSPRGTSMRAGVWVRIRAGRVGRRVFLSVGGRSVSSWLLPGQSASWNGGHSTLFIGGAPDLSYVAPVTWLIIRPYSGCIRKLHVDWRKVIVHLGRARVNSREVRTVAKQPHKFRYDVAQLSPEYIRQVKLNENRFVPHLADEIVSLLRGEILASYVSGKSEGLDTHKKLPGVHVMAKNDPNWTLNFRRGKEFQLLALLTNRTAATQPDDANQVETSTAEYETTTSVEKMTAPGIMPKNLRTRDALFALSSRNIKPCDKSGLAMLQLDPCADNKDDLDCISMPLKERNETENIPGFRGSGWILIRSPLLSSDRNEFSPVNYLNIKFSTKSHNGLLVWIQEDTENQVFVGLGLIDGRLRVVWGSNQNSSNIAVVSSMVNDGQFHRVTILWDVGEKAVVWLDGELGEVENEFKRQKRQFANQGLSALTIAIGGYPSGHLISDVMLAHFNSSFSGCVAELGWNDETARLADYTSYHHEKVFPCSAVL